jgi:hypothetical protein
MAIKRRKFQGVLNILSFNRHFYIISIGLLLILLVSQLLFTWPPMALTIIVAAFLYGLIMPLIVSAWVYDFSRFYEFEWLKKQIDEKERINKIVNINAGFDETSFIIKDLFPGAGIRVFDFYNPKQHTEPAIVRARKVSLVFPDTQQITCNAI